MYHCVLQSLADRFAPVRNIKKRRQRLALWMYVECRPLVDNVASRAASNDAIGELNPSLTGRRWFNRSEHGTRSTDIEKVSTSRQKLRRKLGSQKGCDTRSRVFWGLDQSGSLPKNHPSTQRFLDFFTEKVEVVRCSTAGGTVQYMLSQMNNHVSIQASSKSYVLDPLPSTFMKEFLPELLPYLIDLCHSCRVVFQSANVKL